MHNYFWQSCNIEGTEKVSERYAAVSIDLAVAAVDEAEPASARTQTKLKANSSLANFTPQRRIDPNQCPYPSRCLNK